MPDSMKKTMPLRNPHFLVSCKAYSVKAVFSHDPGCQKSMKNQRSIQKLMPKKVCRNHAKSFNNGCQNAFKIDEKRSPILHGFPSGQISPQESSGPRAAPPRALVHSRSLAFYFWIGGLLSRIRTAFTTDVTVATGSRIFRQKARIQELSCKTSRFSARAECARPSPRSRASSAVRNLRMRGWLGQRSQKRTAVRQAAREAAQSEIYGYGNQKFTTAWQAAESEIYGCGRQAAESKNYG